MDNIKLKNIDNLKFDTVIYIIVQIKLVWFNNYINFSQQLFHPTFAFIQLHIDHISNNWSTKITLEIFNSRIIMNSNKANFIDNILRTIMVI